MMYMIRHLLFIAFAFSSCSQLPLAYAQNFSEVNKVIFGFDNEEILVTHNALSRDIFGEGASLSHILRQKKPGFDTVEDLLKEDN